MDKKPLISKCLAIGIILLFVGTSISVAYDTSTDEVRESPQSLDGFFLDHAFVWGTYENCTKNWIGNFHIWNGEPWFNLTIHVIGYKTSESCYVHIEAYQVKAQRHLGIIGPHQCCIFAFGWLGVTVFGTRQ